jgi:UDP-N-acetyl-D-mannosaminuronate dehydrogenase
MPSFKKRYEKKVKDEALLLMKELSDRIKKGDLVVESSSMWTGTPGEVTIRVVVKESDKSNLF